MEDVAGRFAELVAPSEVEGAWRQARALDVVPGSRMRRLGRKLADAGIRAECGSLRDRLAQAARNAAGELPGRMVDVLFRGGRNAAGEQGEWLAAVTAGGLSEAERVRLGAVDELLWRAWRLERLARSGLADVGRTGLNGRRVLMKRSVMLRCLAERWWRFEGWHRGAETGHAGCCRGCRARV